MDKEILKLIFGEASENSCEMHKMIVDEISKNNYYYAYLDNEAFLELVKKRGVAWANKCVTLETFQRLYLATITGYLRQCKWIDGICQGFKANNFLLFSSSARGFLEAATDYYDALENIPFSFADSYNLLSSAISEEVDDKILSFEEIEENLLHFQEANKAEGRNEPILRPKTAKEYMESKNLKQLNLYDCYSELCEVTHPAKHSLDFFFDNNNNILTINLNKDRDSINQFTNKYSTQYSKLLNRTENLCILIFKTINLFNIEELYMKTADNFNMDSIKGWEKIQKRISK